MSNQKKFRKDMLIGLFDKCNSRRWYDNVFTNTSTRAKRCLDEYKINDMYTNHFIEKLSREELSEEVVDNMRKKNNITSCGKNDFLFPHVCRFDKN